MRYLQSRKGLKLLMIIGLPIILLSLLLIQYLFRNNKSNLLNRAVVYFSKYRALSPYIFAQAKLESANFTSNLYKKINNAFGMGHPTKRPALGRASDLSELNSTYKLQAYRNDTQSVKDFLLWLDYNNFPVRVSDSSQYVALMKSKNYFTSKESDYLKGLNSYLQGTAFVGGGGTFKGSGASGTW
jgi:uncharacterized membrane protein YgcG